MILNTVWCSVFVYVYVYVCAFLDEWCMFCNALPVWFKAITTNFYIFCLTRPGIEARHWLVFRINNSTSCIIYVSLTAVHVYEISLMRGFSLHIVSFQSPVVSKRNPVYLFLCRCSVWRLLIELHC